MSINSILINGTVSNKYYEFIRTSPTDNLIIKARTHKSSYFTRDNYDFRNKSDTIGIITISGFTGSDARELIDYLWFVKNHNIGGHKVLTSYFEEDQMNIIVYHYELLVVYGDFNVNDEITLLKKTYSFNKSSGIINYQENKIRAIKGIGR